MIAEVTRLVQAALADPHQPRCISHRDLNPPNVLADPTGPLSCDFGSSGIDVTWFEAIDVALSFDQEEPITLHSCLAANGPPRPESTEALARQPGRTMSFLAFSMWISLGHRPVTDRQREEATARIPRLMRDLSTRVEPLDSKRLMLFGR
jgi:serine/threonine protein kinase